MSRKNTTLTQTWSRLVVLRKRLLDGQPNAFTKKQLPLQQFRNFIVTLIKKSEMAIFTALKIKVMHEKKHDLYLLKILCSFQGLFWWWFAKNRYTISSIRNICKMYLYFRTLIIRTKSVLNIQKNKKIVLF